MANARKDSSTEAYQPAWRKWSARCDKRNLDPYNSDVTHIINYLGLCFDEGYMHTGQFVTFFQLFQYTDTMLL